MAAQRAWGLDLMEQADNLDTLFPRCSPNQQSPSSHAASTSGGQDSNSSFLSNLQPPPTLITSSVNHNKNSPDFNQNKAALSNSQHKLSRTDVNLISNRMDLSSPTDQPGYGEMFPSGSRDGALYAGSGLHSTSSSGSSSTSGLDTHRRQDRPEAALPLASLVGAQGLPRHIQAVLLPCAVQPPLLPAPDEAPPPLRETIFSSEIRSVEYEEQLPDGAAHRETVLFDDIGDIPLEREDLSELYDPQVTYDLIEGHLPPPGLTVLGPDPSYPPPYRSSVDELLRHTPGPASEAGLEEGEGGLQEGASFLPGRSDPDSGVVTDAGPAGTSPSLGSPALSTRLSILSPSGSPSVSLDNLYLGEEAASQCTKPVPGGAIGVIAIAEYEGSPRRYGPRGATGGRGRAPGRAAPPGLPAPPPEAASASQAAAGRQPDLPASPPQSPTCSTTTLASSRSSPSARPRPVRRVPGGPQRVAPQDVPEGRVKPGPGIDWPPAEPPALLQFTEPGPGPGPGPTEPAGEAGEEAGDMAAASSLARHLPPGAADPGYDYRYEFSETRKVLEEFFKAENEFPACPPVPTQPQHSIHTAYRASQPPDGDLDYSLKRHAGNSYVGQRLALDSDDDIMPAVTSKHGERAGPPDPYSRDLLDLCSSVTPPPAPCPPPALPAAPRPDTHVNAIRRPRTDPTERQTFPEFDPSRELPPPPPAYDSRNFTLSPETTDCDSADLESELSVPSAADCEGSYHSSGPRLHTSMPILEDGLSSGHASELEEEPEEPEEPAPSVLTVAPARRPEGRAQVNGHANVLSNLLALSEERAAERPRLPPPSPAPEVAAPPPDLAELGGGPSVAAAIKDIKKALQSAKTLHSANSPGCAPPPPDPWLPRGGTVQQEIPLPAPPSTSRPPSPPSPACSTPPPPPPLELQEETESEVEEEERVPTPEVTKKEDEDLDTDQETDRLLGQQYNDDTGYYDTVKNESSKKKSSKPKEGPVTDPKVLIEGVLFRARYLGSTQLVCEGQPTKATRMMQAEEAVSRIKAPEGEGQPSTEVDLFISTEKIMVLNTDLKEIMMDHGLRTISYIADIGELVVIMARRRVLPAAGEEDTVIGTTPKMICHVFESEEAQFIAQSIGQAFQVAYMEFLKANGIEDHSFVKEMDYQEVLNSQEIFGDELAMFAKKELQKEVVVPKAKGEILGVVIVESGWGSMLPTIVIANLCPNGPAARCGQLNIGDQVIAINGVSLVGLPLSTCQQYIKNTKTKTVVKLTAVSCPPVVEVKIKRPDTKYQLGFSVQNGVICSLLRGGIAERGGVRVGHRIIEINGQSVVAVPHERIVNLLATSVGEIHMKTMPTSMYRLLTGQENPVYI